MTRYPATRAANASAAAVLAGKGLRDPDLVAPPNPSVQTNSRRVQALTVARAWLSGHVTAHNSHAAAHPDGVLCMSRMVLVRDAATPGLCWVRYPPTGALADQVAMQQMVNGCADAVMGDSTVLVWFGLTGGVVVGVQVRDREVYNAQAGGRSLLYAGAALDGRWFPLVNGGPLSRLLMLDMLKSGIQPIDPPLQ